MQNMVMGSKLLFGLVTSWFSFAPYPILQVNIEKPEQILMQELKTFDTSFMYPIGEDKNFSFKLGSGSDYFSFFKRLGTPYFYVTRYSGENKTIKQMVDNKEVLVERKHGDIAGAVCFVLENIKTPEKGMMEAWHICGLKVDKKYQDELLSLHMMKKAGFKRFWQCPRGYAVWMNKPVAQQASEALEKEVNFMKRFRKRVYNVHQSIRGHIKSFFNQELRKQTLNFYVLTAELVDQHGDVIQKTLSNLGYLNNDQKLVLKSSNGVKDFLISHKSEDTMRPWNVIHLQRDHKDVLGLSTKEHPDATYIICAVDKTALDNNFRTMFGVPRGTAEITSFGMENIDFNFLTSNQI